jgi:BMFP domain-containing protein YqiC
LRGLQQDLESNFRTVLRATLGRLDLVAREEFDAQTKVLERTRSKAEALEARLAELERAMSAPAARAAAPPTAAPPAASVPPSAPPSASMPPAGSMPPPGTS